MRLVLIASCLSLAASGISTVAAAEVDARPPDRLALTATGTRLLRTDDGGGGSLNWTHFFTPDAVVGVGGEYQQIAEAQWSFGSLRGSLSRGEPGSKSGIFAEMSYGDGDEAGRDFSYSVAVLGLSQSFGTKFFVQLEGRQIDIDTTHGNLPKLGLTYILTPRFAINVGYAQSIGGNLGTELTTTRMDHYGQHVTLTLGGAFGQADPSVINLQPGLQLPAKTLKEGFVGIGKTFSRGEVQLIGDYLKLAESEKVTLTLSFTAYLGSRGRAR